ncbi:hypothetical protein [Geobacter sp. SVR]|uniref:hypothetical protein n=1 Tax=Geobacter sp. SVR TaxID=2495594 RepID=UPI00143EFD39|nr:hypothetical protein [Geobacter sp. SVR]BCS55165.1 hypothetical protein GSVR_34730 [Geobacter sp. SVR]GCF85346.1 hypothetical protein GSbR_19460 [Geobacter sp. SVR]
MGTLAEIEQATKAFADRRELLALRIEDLHTDIESMKRERLPAIKEAAADAANAKAALEAIIDDSRAQFVKPRSIIISGIRVGLQKGKGGLDYEDEATVIRLIRKHLPAEQHELLIKTIEKVIKKALSELDVTTLKKIGVTVQGTGDVVLIKPVDSDVDKIVNAMLKEAAGDAEGVEVE